MTKRKMDVEGRNILECAFAPPIGKEDGEEE
jgi:hypothetical protein